MGKVAIVGTPPYSD